MKRTLWLSVCWLVTAPPVGAQTWTVHTHVKEVRRLLTDSQHVYAVTAGGLYRRADTDTDTSYQVFNSGDGLGSHDLWGAARVGDTFWLGSGDALLTRLHPATGDVRRYPLALGISRIEAIVNSGDTLWLGTDIGVGVFLKGAGGGLLKEVYARLGALPTEEGVHDLMLYGGRLWVATSAGVVSADPADPALHIPDRWTDHPGPAAALQAARRFAIFADSLFAATDLGLYVLEDSVFAPRFSERAVRGLFATADTLWMATDSGAYHYAAGVAEHHASMNLTRSRLEHIARVPGGDLWVSAARSDLYRFGSFGPWWAIASINQPPGPAFNGVSVTEDGLWCAHRGDGASYLRAESAWMPLPEPVPSNGAPAYSVRSTPQVAYYPGWCQGLHVIKAVADSFDITQYMAANSSLEPAKGESLCTVVADVSVDEAGGFWVANRFPENLQSLVYFGPGGTPQIVYGPADGLPRDNDMNVLLLTGGRLWIGYNGGGLVVLDFRGTPQTKSDDTVVTFTRDEYRDLPGDVITALCADRLGKVWVGTPSGLARIDQQFFPFITIDVAEVRPADGAILALTTDFANTLWVGTDRGLARIPSGARAADSTWFAGASPLPNNRVLSLALDAVRSRLWIGTQNGLAARPLLSGEPPQQSTAVSVFPNPLHPRVASDVATFDVPSGARVDIFTLAGDRVRSLTERYTWDGTNDDRQPVASGLYLFRVTYADGSVGRGRLGLIRD